MFDRCRLQAGLPGDPAGPIAARVDRLPSYPLTICGYGESELQLGMIWDGRRFAEGSVDRMLAQLRATLVEFASRPSAALADLALGADAEAELRSRWNGGNGSNGSDSTAARYPREASLPELFAAQVAVPAGRGRAGVGGRHPELCRAGPAQQRPGLGAARARRRPGPGGGGGAAARRRADRGAAGRAQGRWRVPADRPEQPAGPGRRHDRRRPAGDRQRRHRRRGARGRRRRAGSSWPS